MRKYLLSIALLLLLSLTACESSDPLTEGLYNSDGFYAVGGGHLSREDSTGTGGGYWHEHLIDAIDASPGSSGATLIAPNASSIGGYQFNAIGEYLFFDGHVEADWDGIGDGVLHIVFEVNDDNSGGLDTDTVKIQVECWHKSEGDRATTVYSLEGNTVVGKAQQHDMFEQDVVIGNLHTDEVIAFRLNLNTILSDVTDIIVNQIEFKYPTYYPALEN